MQVIETFYPLSPAQAGLLFHTVASPDAAVYFQQMSCVVRGRLDAAAWQRAVDRVAAAHPALRTAFIWEGVDQPVQAVRHQAQVPIDVQDWRGLESAEQPERLEAYLRSDRRRGFDLKVPPLMRMALLRIADDAHFLVWSHHHLVLDGWSMQLLYQQIFEQYEAELTGEPRSLRPGRPYRDYISWLLKQDQAEAERFWRRELAGVRRPTPLGGRPASLLPEGDDDAHADVWVELTVEEQERLQLFGRQQRVTASTILQGAWALLLGGHAGEETVVFGATVSGRPPELEGVGEMVGLFVNVQPVRVHLAAEQTVSAWLRQLQLGTAEGRTYEHASMSSIQSWSEMERGLPLFESLVTIKNYPVRSGETEGEEALRFEEIRNFERTSYPLCLVGDVGRTIELQITYNPLRFGSGVVEGMAGHFRALLRELTGDPARKLGEVVQSVVGGRRLSPSQRQLSRAAEQAPGLPVRVVVAVQVERAYTLPELDAALRRAVRRHEILRTHLQRLPGLAAPLQVVRPAAEPRCDRRDPDGAPDALERLVDEHLRGAERHGAAGEVWMTLVPRGEAGGAVVLSLPGVLGDVQAAHLLLGEVLADAAGDPPQAAPAQYSTLSDWQNELAGSGEAREVRRHWREMALPEPPPLPLETAGAAGAFDFGVATGALAPGAVRLLEEVNDRYETSAPVFLLACWAVLLSRLTEREDAVLGVVFDGRIHPDLQDAIGTFERTLPLELRAAAGEPFLDVVRRAEEAATEAFHAQGCFVPEDLQRPGTPGAGPMPRAFQCLEEAPARLVARTAGERYTAKLVCSPRGEEFQLDLYHDRSRLGETAAGLLLSRFRELVGRALAQPEAPVGTLEVGSAADDALLDEWNRTGRPWEGPGTMDLLLAERMARTPGAVAVRSGAETITYAELDARSGRLARHLRAIGVGPEVVVGVCLERSPDLVVSLLAVLRAGGAYVPLDPQHPAERLRYVVEDAGAALVLSGGPAAATVAAALAGEAAAEDATRVRVVRVDADAGEWANGDAAAPEPLARPESLAYVLYTSGTTGRPKGVGIPHRALVNQLRWLLEAYGLGAGDRVLQRTAPGFDASVWEIYAPLLAGAELVLAPQEVPTAEELVELFQRAGVTVVQVTPTLLQLLLDVPALAACDRLRRVCCGGEVFLAGLARRAAAALPAAELVNLYGPTETAVQVASWRHVPASAGGSPEADAAAGVPIGRPVANTSLHVLDGRGLPVPVGVPGEIHVGGVQVGRGYLRRPALTAETFVPDPFGTEPGARLYRTGDRARWRADGALEYLGRLDRQVKVRGVRIEPGEIEGVLAGHPAVRQVAVDVRAGAQGAVRLVAWVVRAPDAAPSADELREWLRRMLPETMVPAAFVWMPSLPLTASAKVDRAALPDPTPVRAGASGRGTSNATEETLLEIWKELLRVPGLSVSDNFFEMGGDSILALQVVARTRQAGIRITPLNIFEHPTVETLAAVAVPLAEAAGAAQDEPGGSIPLTPIQADFFGRGYPELDHYNQSNMLEPLRPLEPALLREALARVVAQHDALRLRFRHDDETGWRQLVAPREEHEILSVVDLPGGPDPRAVIEAAAAAAQGTLDIREGPLVRAVLLRTPETSRLLLVVHHQAIDNVSWPIVLSELVQAYEQLRGGEPVRLERPAVSFARWARGLGAYARSEEVARTRGYWLSPERHKVGRLPVDHESAPDTEASARTMTSTLDAADTEALFHYALGAYRMRPHEVVLTALASALQQWSGHRRVLVDVEGHGREELPTPLDVSRTCGWFTMLVPTLLECGPAGDTGAALEAVKEQLRAMPQRGISYGLLRYMSDDADLKARLAELPRPQVSFNYLGEVGGGEDNAGWRQAAEDRGPLRHPDAPRTHLIDVMGAVEDGELRVEWTYSANRHEQTGMERLARTFVDQLHAIIEHCQSPDAGGLTPSDFPHAGLSREALDALLPQIG